MKVYYQVVGYKRDMAYPMAYFSTNELAEKYCEKVIPGYTGHILRGVRRVWSNTVLKVNDEEIETKMTKDSYQAIENRRINQRMAAIYKLFNYHLGPNGLQVGVLIRFEDGVVVIRRWDNEQLFICETWDKALATLEQAIQIEAEPAVPAKPSNGVAELVSAMHDAQAREASSEPKKSSGTEREAYRVTATVEVIRTRTKPLAEMGSDVPRGLSAEDIATK